MGLRRTSTWILIASFIASVHLMPGVHELSHDGHPAHAEASDNAETSAAEAECDFCALLSGARLGLTGASSHADRTVPAPTRLEALPESPHFAARFDSPASPRAPPAA